MFTKMNVQDWLSLPWETRAKLIETFKIPRSGGTHVIGGTVKTDGYTEEDLSVMNVESLQAFTGLSTGNFIDLFKETLMKIHLTKLQERYEQENSQEHLQSGGTTEDQTGGPNAGESKKPTVPTTPENGGNSGGDENVNTDSLLGSAPSIQQPDADSNSGRNENGRKARQKK